MAVLSPAIIPVVYDQFQIQKHGSVEMAAHVNYKVPLVMVPFMMKATWGLLAPIQVLAYRFFANVVMPIPALDAEKKSE
jgi:hypothetical protein